MCSIVFLGCDKDVASTTDGKKEVATAAKDALGDLK